ncbi:MAG: Rab family GTPase [Promethearchaeota archaeon]
MESPKQVNYNYLFKVIVVGEGGVGKTTFINRFATNKFNEDTKITIGASFYAFENNVNGGDTSVKLQVWDFGGEKRFRFILPSYCLGAHGVIFAFDLTRATTLWNLNEWIDLVMKNTENNPVFLLIGTKADQVESNGYEMISDEQIKEFMETHYICPHLFFKTSSLTGENVKDVFAEISNLLYKKAKKYG